MDVTVCHCYARDGVSAEPVSLQAVTKPMGRFGTLLRSPNSIAPRPNRRNALRSTPAFRRRSCTLLAGDFVESPEGREVCLPVFSQLGSSQQPEPGARLLFFARISPQRSQAPSSPNAQEHGKAQDAAYCMRGSHHSGLH